MPGGAVTLVTQVVVSQHDPAMTRPSKPVGSFLTQAQAEAAQARDGWAVAEDAGRGWRRVVPSPSPCEIVEIDAIKTLAEAGHIVIACGGGGIPVVREAGELHGIWAVIDKDLTSSLLAQELHADVLLVLTGVDRVALGFKTPSQRWLDRISAADLRAALDAGEFPAGSMAPKVRAVLEFLDAGGTTAIITDTVNATAAIDGRAGTRIEA